MGSKYTEVPNPGFAAFIGFAALARPIRFESAEASAFHILPFDFNAADATGTQRIGL